MSRRLATCLTLLFLFPACCFAAVSSWSSNPQGRVRLIANWDVAPSSGPVWLGLHHQPAPGWTLYWKKAGDAGIPPKLVWKKADGIADPRLLYPIPTRFILPGDVTEIGYEGETVYPIQVKRAGGAIDARVEVSYLTCDTSCIPYKYTFALKVPSGGAPRRDLESAALIERAITRLPPADWTDEKVLQSIQTVPLNPGGASGDSAPSQSLWAMLLIAFLGGIVLNIMPCVLPVLSIKLLGLLQHGGQSRRIVVRDALASVAGILTSFALLAAAVITAQKAGVAAGWGIQFQEPVFVGSLALVILLFALNLWGVFEIHLPPALARVGAVSPDDEGLGSFFASGFFATLLATPCSAPFLGTAMGFALTQPPLTVLAIFLAVGAGLASPYMLLALVPRAVQWLPRPGAWMLRVKGALGFLLAATVAWLLFVLAGQVTSTGIVWFGLALVGTGFVVWCRETAYERDRYGRGAQALFWIALLGVMALGLRSLTVHRRSAVAARAQSEDGLVWQPFSDAAIAGALGNGKSVFVDVTADWCLTCKVNERTTLRQPDVVKALGAPNMVLLRADWTNRDAAIGAFLKRYGRVGIPFYAVFHPGESPRLLSEFLRKDQVLKALETPTTSKSGS